MLLSREALKGEVSKLKQTVVKQLADKNSWVPTYQSSELPEQLLPKYQALMASLAQSPDSDESLELVMWKVEGQLGNLTSQALTKELAGWLKCNQKIAKRKLNKIGDRKSYSLDSSLAKQLLGQEVTEESFQFAIWEVKKKYLQEMKSVGADVDLLTKSRRIRSRKIEVLNSILKLIKDINDTQKPEGDLGRRFLKAWGDYDEFRKELEGTSTRKTKKKKAQPSTGGAQIQVQEPNIPSEGAENPKEAKSADEEGTPKKDVSMEIQGGKTRQFKQQLQQSTSSKTNITTNKGTPSKLDTEDVVVPPAVENNTKKLVKPNTQKKPQVAPDNTQRKINFFLKAKPNPAAAVQPPKSQTAMDIEPESKNTSPFEQSLKNIGVFMRSLESLRSQIKTAERAKKPDLVHAHIWDSMFYLRGYPMSDPKKTNKYLVPLDQYSQVEYVDSQADFDNYQAQGQALQGFEEQRSQDHNSDQSSNKGFIVDDSYLSKEEKQLSDQGPKAVVCVQSGERWTFTAGSEKSASYQMVCLESTIFPLVMKIDKTKITQQQHVFFATTVHGSYESMAELVDKLREKFSETPKQTLRNFIQEYTNKDKMRRLLKPLFIADHQQALQAYNTDLEDIAAQRFKQNAQDRSKKRMEKRLQREQTKQTQDKQQVLDFKQTIQVQAKAN